MKTVKKHLPPKQYDYCERTALVEEYRFGTKYDCERVIIYRWTDNNDLQITHIRGDGRTTNFTKFLDVTIPNGTTNDIQNALNNILNQ